jgi:hypothetical protein
MCSIMAYCCSNPRRSKSWRRASIAQNFTVIWKAIYLKGDKAKPNTPSPEVLVDVVPILRACASCHSGGAGEWTYTGGAGAYVVSVVDTVNPEESLLLVMATSRGGHGGGTVFRAGSSAYATVRAWIEQGRGGSRSVLRFVV